MNFNFNFKIFKKPDIERMYNLDGLAYIEALADGQIWSPIEQWREFQKAVEHSKVVTDPTSYVRVGFYEEIYVVVNYKPSIGFASKFYIFIRFANGAWGMVDRDVVQQNLKCSFGDGLNPHKLAAEIYRLFEGNLQYAADVLENTTLLEGHHIRFEYNGIMGRSVGSQMSLSEMFAHVVQRNSVPTTWGVRQYNSNFLELMVLGLLVGQAHAGHVMLRLIPEDFLGMFS